MTYTLIPTVGSGVMAHEVPSEKLEASISASTEVLADAGLVAAAWHRAMTATPEQQAQRQAELRAQRQAERARTPRSELILDALTDALGWNRGYAEHFVQPYCGCGPDRDVGGWYVCPHAEDEGVAP